MIKFPFGATIIYMATRRRAKKKQQKKISELTKEHTIKLFERAKTKAIEKARQHLQKVFLNRAAVGQLALQTIEMKWAEGGFRGRIASEYRHKAIVEFAKELGISPTVLYDWIQSIEESLYCARKSHA